MLHLNISAMSCGVQPTASRPAHIAPALLPAIRFTFVRIPASASAYSIHSKHLKHMLDHSLASPYANVLYHTQCSLILPKIPKLKSCMEVSRGKFKTVKSCDAFFLT